MEPVPAAVYAPLESKTIIAPPMHFVSPRNPYTTADPISVTFIDRNKLGLGLPSLSKIPHTNWPAFFIISSPHALLMTKLSLPNSKPKTRTVVSANFNPSHSGWDTLWFRLTSPPFKFLERGTLKSGKISESYSPLVRGRVAEGGRGSLTPNLCAQPISPCF